MIRALLLAFWIPVACLAAERGKGKPPEISPIDQLLERSRAAVTDSSPGSAYDGAGRYAELFKDLRASNVGDILTIVVSERASAVSRGSTASTRDSDVNASITAFGGPLPAAGTLSSLAAAKSKTQLNGQGETTRETALTTRLSVRVTHVLPNGNLVVEGGKEIAVNSERQRVSVRGIVRWNDLTQANTVSSDRVSDLEIRIDGKGVVQDAIRRPNFLYRLLLGILPF